jgi:hypothetical protein
MKQSLVLALFTTALAGPGCTTDGELFTSRSTDIPLLTAATGLLEGPSSIGEQVVDVGDLDGDGLHDLAVSERGYLAPGDGVVTTCYEDNGITTCEDSTPFRGAVHIVYGGHASSGAVDFVSDAILEGSKRENLELQIHAAGDLDGDGLADVVITELADACADTVPVPAPHAASYVVYGSSVRFAAAARLGDVATVVTDPDACGVLFAMPAGDLDGDGRGDLAYHRFDAGIRHAGRTTLFYGRVDRFGGAVSLADADAHLQQDATQGSYVPAAIGDFDGDGKDDLAIVEWDAPGTIVASRSRVIWGSSTRLAGDLDWADVPLAIDGSRAVRMIRLGDLDVDGADDIAILADGLVWIAYGGARPAAATLAAVSSARLGVQDLFDGLDTRQRLSGIVIAGPIGTSAHRDLVIQIRERNRGVWVLNGDSARLSGDVDLDFEATPYVGHERFYDTEDEDGEIVTVEQGEYAGESAAILDLDGDGDAELYVGAPGGAGQTGPLSGLIYVLQ